MTEHTRRRFREARAAVPRRAVAEPRHEWQATDELLWRYRGFRCPGDAEPLDVVRGRVLGGSSAGANVFAAVQVAKRLGKGKRVVTIIPDSAERYMSKNIFEGGE